MIVLALSISVSFPLSFFSFPCIFILFIFFSTPCFLFLVFLSYFYFLKKNGLGNTSIHSLMAIMANARLGRVRKWNPLMPKIKGH